MRSGCQSDGSSLRKRLQVETKEADHAMKTMQQSSRQSMHDATMEAITEPEMLPPEFPGFYVAMTDVRRLP